MGKGLRHKRHRSTGSMAQRIQKEREKEKEREARDKDDKDKSATITDEADGGGGSTSSSAGTGIVIGAGIKKYERYCFLFDDLLVVSKKADLSTFLNAPSNTLEYIKKFRMYKTLRGRPTALASFGELAGAGEGGEPQSNGTYEYCR